MYIKEEALLKIVTRKLAEMNLIKSVEIYQRIDTNVNRIFNHAVFHSLDMSNATTVNTKGIYNEISKQAVMQPSSLGHFAQLDMWSV